MTNGIPTLGQIQRNRGLANMMTQRSFGGPVIAPMQGIGRLAQALSGRLLANRADRQETERREAAQSRLAELLSGAPSASVTVPGTVSGGVTLSSGGMAPSPVPGAPGGVAGPIPSPSPGPGAVPIGSVPRGFTMRGAAPAGPSVQDMLSTVQTFPELAGILQPMIAQRMKPTEPVKGVVVGRGGTLVHPITGETIAEGVAPSETLREIADPTSPTGTRLVPLSEASGMAGPPRSEFRVETVTGPDGETRTVMVRGRPGAAEEPESVTKPTASKLEQSITQATTALGRIGRISENLNDEFLRLPEQLRMRGAAFAERLGAELEPETKQKLQRFTRFKTSTLSNLNRTLNELSGAAISPAEAKRLEGELPTMDDSPTEFRSKVAEIEQSIQAAIRRNQQLLTRGVVNLEFDRSGEIKGTDIPTLEEFMLMEESPPPTAATAGGIPSPVPPSGAAPPTRLRFDAEGNIIE